LPLYCQEIPLSAFVKQVFISPLTILDITEAGVSQLSPNEQCLEIPDCWCTMYTVTWPVCVCVCEKDQCCTAHCQPSWHGILFCGS